MNEFRPGAGAHRKGEPITDAIPANPLATRVLALPAPELHFLPSSRYLAALGLSTSPGPAVQVVDLLSQIREQQVDKSENPVIASFPSEAVPFPSRWNRTLARAIVDLGDAVGLRIQVRTPEGIHGEPNPDRLAKALGVVELPDSLQAKIEQRTSTGTPSVTPDEGTAVFEAAEHIPTASEPDFVLTMRWTSNEAGKDRQLPEFPSFEPSLTHTISIEIPQHRDTTADLARAKAKLLDLVGGVEGAQIVQTGAQWHSVVNPGRAPQQSED